MAFTVVYDACVLYPAPLRDLLVRVGMAGPVRVRWTDQILDECFRSIVARRPELADALPRTRELMNRAIRDVVVTGYESLVEGLSLPDPDDRHVLAAAIRAGAQSIITFNLKDFPPSSLDVYGVEAVHPDDFIEAMIDLAPGSVYTAVVEQAEDLTDPPMGIADVLEVLSRQGLVKSVAKLKALASI